MIGSIWEWLTRGTPVQYYRGWEVYYCGEHPVTGRYRAYRFGVRIGAGSLGDLQRMITERNQSDNERIHRVLKS